MVRSTNGAGRGRRRWGLLLGNTSGWRGDICNDDGGGGRRSGAVVRSTKGAGRGRGGLLLGNTGGWRGGICNRRRPGRSSGRTGPFSTISRSTDSEELSVRVVLLLWGLARAAFGHQSLDRLLHLVHAIVGCIHAIIGRVHATIELILATLEPILATLGGGEAIIEAGSESREIPDLSGKNSDRSGKIGDLPTNRSGKIFNSLIGIGGSRKCCLGCLLSAGIVVGGLGGRGGSRGRSSLIGLRFIDGNHLLGLLDHGRILPMLAPASTKIISVLSISNVKPQLFEYLSFGLKGESTEILLP